MANTFSILDFNNTFGDWFVATNNLVKENNDFAANNYVKPTGTLFLNDPALGLQTANSAIIGGALQVQGTGSSAYVQNNLRVDGQIYFTNPTLGLTNSGQANIGGPLLALGSGNGLQVANNALIENSLSVLNNETVGNNLTVVANTRSNNLSVAYQTISKTLLVNTTARVDDSIFIANNSFANYIQANSSIATINTMSSFGVTTAYLQANSAVNTMVLTTNTINCLNKAYVNILQANTSVNTAFLTVSANANLASLIVTGNATFVAKANTVNDLGVGTNLYVYGNEAITGTLNVTGKTTLVASSNTINDLGIGTNLYVSGNEVVTGTTTLTGKANTVNDLGVGINLYVAGNGVVTGTSVHTGKTTLVASSNTINDLGIGTNLYVAGNEVVTGNKTVIGITTLTSKANALADFGVSGNQYVTGVSVHTGKTTLVASSNTTNDLGIGTNLYVSGNEVVTGLLNVTGKTTLVASSNTTNDLGIGTNLYVSGNEVVTGTTTLTGKTTLVASSNTTNDLGIGGNQYITGNQTTYGNQVVNGTTTLTGKANTGYDLGIGSNLYITGNQTAYGNQVVNGTTTLIGKANTTNDLGVGGNQYVTGVSVHTGRTTLVASSNTTNDLGIGGNQYITGNQIVTGTTTLIGKANTTNDLGVGGTLYAPRIVIPSGGSLLGDIGQGGALITANAVSVGLGGLSVTGNFTINGSTVYNTNQFVLSAGSPNPTFAQFGVFRNTNGSSNAFIRWNETSKIWDLTANTSTEPYYRILTDQYINNTGTLNSSTNVASSMALYVANTFLQTTISNANTQLRSYTDGQLSANLAYSNGVNATQNTRLSTVEANTIYLFGALNQANTNAVNANTQLKAYVDGQINNTLNYSNGIDVAQNTRLSTVEANTIYLFGALNQANTNAVNANTQLKAYTDGRFVNPSFTGSGTITADLTIGGNLFVNGTTTTINTNTIQTNDSVIKLANNNIVSDTLDIGFYGTYNSAGVKYAGLVREGSAGTNAGTFYLFKDLTTEPTSNTVNYASLTKASLVADGSLITGLNASSITSGTIPSSILGTSTVYIGTTGIALNRSSAVQSLTGVSIDGNANNATYFNTYPTSYFAANTTIVKYVDTQLSANLAYISGVDATQNTRLLTVEANTVYLFGALNATNTSIVNANTQLKAYTDGQISLSYTYNNGVNSAQNTAIISANTQLKAYTDGQFTNVYNYYNGVESAQNTAIISANTQLKAYTDGQIISANTQLKAYTDGQFNNGTTNAYFNTIGIGVAPDTANVGSIVTSGDITAYYSDENLKNKLGNIENALDKVSSLNGFYYEANETAQELGYKVKREVGVSAQEVQKVLPEVVVPAPIDDKYLTVHYERIIPLLIEAIKELKSEIEELKNR